jgi:hypothetical protein
MKIISDTCAAIPRQVVFDLPGTVTELEDAYLASLTSSAEVIVAMKANGYQPKEKPDGDIEPATVSEIRQYLPGIEAGLYREHALEAVKASHRAVLSLHCLQVETHTDHAQVTATYHEYPSVTLSPVMEADILEKLRSVQINVETIAGHILDVNQKALIFKHVGWTEADVCAVEDVVVCNLTAVGQQIKATVGRGAIGEMLVGKTVGHHVVRIAGADQPLEIVAILRMNASSWEAALPTITKVIGESAELLNQRLWIESWEVAKSQVENQLKALLADILMKGIVSSTPPPWDWISEMQSRGRSVEDSKAHLFMTGAIIAYNERAGWFPGPGDPNFGDLDSFTRQVIHRLFEWAVDSCSQFSILKKENTLH